MKLNWRPINFKKNFRYNSDCVDSDYSTEYDCEDGSDCCKDDYCRCGRIIVNKIEVKDLIKIGDEFFGVDPAKDIFRYALDRLLRIYKVYGENSWIQEVEGGYYGEELGELRLESNISAKLEKSWNLLKDLDLNQIVEFLLIEEYGVLPNQYKNLNWRSEQVDPGKIQINNMLHLSRASQDSGYEDYPSFICLCKNVNGENSIIDGYHRLAANINKPKIQILLGSKNE